MASHNHKYNISVQTHSNLTFSLPEAQLIFEPLSFQEMEGASFNVCLRLGGEGWFDLEREVEAILGSDGGK